MKRTTVSLPEELQADLAQVAREVGRSEEDLILEGVRLVVRPRTASSYTISVGPRDQNEVLAEIRRRRSFSPAAAGTPGSTALLREDRDR